MSANRLALGPLVAADPARWLEAAVVAVQMEALYRQRRALTGKLSRDPVPDALGELGVDECELGADPRDVRGKRRVGRLHRKVHRRGPTSTSALRPLPE